MLGDQSFFGRSPAAVRCVESGLGLLRICLTETSLNFWSLVASDKYSQKIA